MLISVSAQNTQTREEAGASPASPLSRPLQAIAAEREADAKVHVVVGLAKSPAASDRRALSSMGLRLLDPLPGGRHHAVVDLAGTAARLIDSRSYASLGLAGASELSVDEKLSDPLSTGDVPVWAQTEVHGAPGAEIQISYFADSDVNAIVAALSKFNATNVEVSTYFERITARIPVDRLRSLAKSDWVRFIESIPAPARALNNSASAALIKANEVQSDPVNLTGDGVRVAVVDEGRVFEHQEFGTRLTVVEGSSTSTHSTHVAGTLAASGEFDARLKGIAPKSLLYTYSFTGDVPNKMLAARQNYGVQTISNSWGQVISAATNNCSSFGSYGLAERDMDRLVRQERISLVFAMGNERDEPGCTLAERAGFFSTGRPAAAKNVISVAAVDGATAPAYFSNYGPTKDGRLKPDISALGTQVRSTAPGNATTILSGTSMSTPAVSGLLALMIERYRQLNDSQSPDPALLKAVLLNTAEDLGNAGPDYTFGYGLANAVKAVNTLNDRRYLLGRASDGSVRHAIEVPGGTPVLRVMLAYIDTEATGGAGRSLVNNLNLRLIAPDGSTETLPLTLDPANPGADAQPGVNDRDPVEQVFVRNPAPGTWAAEIVPASLPAGEQDYALAWEFSDVPPPACTISITPISISLTKEAGATAIAVTSPSQCEGWTAESDGSWLQVRPAGEPRGSRALKLEYPANEGPGTRTATVSVAGSRVQVTQEAPCFQIPIERDIPVSGTLSSRDCLSAEDTYERWYTFQATAGQKVAVSLTSRSFDAWLELRTEAGMLIAADDDGGGGTNARIPAVSGMFTIPVTGKYVIVASTYDPRETGSFTLTLTVEDGAPTNDLPRVLTGCPATLEGTLSPESSRLGRRGDLYATDIYYFPGRIGQQITVEIAEAGFDSVVYLISPSGRLVALNDDASGAASRIESITLTESGQWRIDVTGYSPGALGAYRGSVQGCSAPPD